MNYDVAYKIMCISDTIKERGYDFDCYEDLWEQSNEIYNEWEKWDIANDTDKLSWLGSLNKFLDNKEEQEMKIDYHEMRVKIASREAENMTGNDVIEMLLNGYDGYMYDDNKTIKEIYIDIFGDDEFPTTIEGERK